MPRKVNVIGVGMVPFAKPGKSEEYHVMATKAGTAALAKRLADNPGLQQELHATVVLDVKDAGVRHTIGSGDKPDAVLTLDDADLASLASGKATAQRLYQQGKLRIDGDVSVGHRLGFLKGLV